MLLICLTNVLLVKNKFQFHTIWLKNGVLITFYVIVGRNLYIYTSLYAGRHQRKESGNVLCIGWVGTKRETISHVKTPLDSTKNPPRVILHLLALGVFLIWRWRREKPRLKLFSVCREVPRGWGRCKIRRKCIRGKGETGEQK